MSSYAEDSHVQTETEEMNKQLTDCRATLIESKSSLLQVSEYCDKNYMENRSNAQNAKNW